MRNFTLALEHLKEKAMFLQLMDLNPNNTCQILDTILSQCSSYNCEIQGMYTKQDFKTWDKSGIEKKFISTFVNAT